MTNYIADSNLSFVVEESYFKDNGYVYQELFADDIPFYHKDRVGEHHIWCRSEEKTFFVSDWYDFLTPTILNYYIQNRNSDKVVTSKTFDDYQSISTRINRKTGEIKTKIEIYSELSDGLPMSLETIDKYHDSVYYNEWHELVLVRSCMDELVDEVNRLTNNKFEYTK